MILELYKRAMLTRDIPEANLYKGDVAVIVEFIDHPSGQGKGAILEVFNVLGESIDVVTVPVSALAALSANQMPSVRERVS